MPEDPKQKIKNMSIFLASWMYLMVMIDNSSFFDKTLHIQCIIRKLSHAQQRQSAILGALEQSNLFGPSNKVLHLKKLVIKRIVHCLILFVLEDAISQKWFI